MRELAGRVAVVTGAASGIGRALAERFTAEGMTVVLADVERDALRRAASELAAAGAETLAVPTDVSDAEDVTTLADIACARFGTVHVVCNNAGVIGQWDASWEASAAEWRWVLDVNLWGVVNGIRTFLPILLAQDEGHVVNTASAAAWQSAPGNAAYAASKHAVLGLSESLRLELEGRGSSVGVSVLCPQFVRTAILTAGRNWPGGRLGDPPPPGGGGAAGVGRAVGRAIASGVPPAAVADVVVAGIRLNRFVISEDPAAIAASADRRAAIARGDVPRFGS